MQASKEKSALKMLAQSAKDRLKSGYWQTLTSDGIRNMEFKRKQELYSVYNYGNEEQLYAKVRAMLSEDECIFDPLGRLLNKDLYDSLDQPARMRYILQLSKVFIRLKDRFYREKN